MPETKEEILRDLQRSIDELETDDDRMCGAALSAVGLAVAALVGKHDWSTIEEMRTVCESVFRNAESLRLAAMVSVN
jgi:hypothetical protein